MVCRDITLTRRHKILMSNIRDICDKDGQRLTGHFCSNSEFMFSVSYVGKATENYPGKNSKEILTLVCVERCHGHDID